MKKLNRLGEKNITKQGYEIEIIDYINNENLTVLFSDGYISHNKKYTSFKKGVLLNPYHPTVCNIGYIGEEKYNKNNKYNPKIYPIWGGIIRRCYDDKAQEKTPTYIDCSVDERWHNYQNFAKWYEENYVEGFHLDKDILIKGNKIYSPETCCFVPREINHWFREPRRVKSKDLTGIDILKNNKFQARFCTSIGRISKNFNTFEEAFSYYKTKKEHKLKELADTWKDKITKQVYQALYTYQVDIID